MRTQPTTNAQAVSTIASPAPTIPHVSVATHPQALECSLAKGAALSRATLTVGRRSVSSVQILVQPVSI